MAKPLNLRTQNFEDGSVIVSWNDTYLPEFSSGAQIGFGLVVGLGTLALILIGVFSMNLWFALFAMILCIGGVVMFKTTKTRENGVSFSRDLITHNGKKFATADVTRFEYGLRSQLTGNAPNRDGNGNPMADPTLIRMWIEDSYPYVISENNWEFQVTHAIRDALDKALLSVKKREKKRQTQQTFGKQSKFGIPEY